MTRFELFETIVRSVSTNILIPQLPADVRWHLLLDVLRGMSPFRGGRLRDFPFSEQREVAAKLAFTMCSEHRTGAPGRNGEKGTYSLYDLLSSLVLMDMAFRVNARIKNELIEDEYFTWLIIRICNEAFEENHEAQRAAMLLGVDIDEWEDLQEKSNRDPNHIFKNAVTLAVIANYNFRGHTLSQKHRDLTDHFDIHPNKLDLIESLTVDILYLKTRNVQTLLNRCKSNFVLRGASFWCSQVMSLTRDVLCEFNNPDSHLFTDSDSIIMLVLNDAKDQQYYHDKVRRFFLDTHRPDMLNKEMLVANYPRLEHYYEECARTNMTMSQALPNIGISVRKRVSLLELAIDSNTEKTRRNSHWNDDNTLIFQPSMTRQVTKNCWGYTGEDAFTAAGFRIPPWYNLQNKDEAYGWSATLYSLTDITFRQQVFLELQSWLNREVGRWLGLSRYSKNMAKDLGFDDKLSYIKIDGDDVGNLFSSAAFVSRPRISICLEEYIKDRFLNAVKQLVENHHLSKIPVTLVYFGGDDLVVSLPSGLERDFLSCFASERRENCQSSPMVNFSSAVIRYSNIDFSDKTKAQDMLQAEIPRLLNPLLELSKLYFKENTNFSEQPGTGKLSEKATNFLQYYAEDLDTFDIHNLHGVSVELTELRP